MNHNINEIQLPNAKEAADREEVKFKGFVEIWARMSDEDLRDYPNRIWRILAHRRELSMAYLSHDLIIASRNDIKTQLIYANDLIKKGLGLL